MPLELGLFLGAKRFGVGLQTRKSCLVLDRDKYRYQEYISDIAGQDIAAHGNAPTEGIKAVRDWLSISKASIRRLPGGAAIAGRYSQFVDELHFVEYADMASTWLKRELQTRD